eukprot:COSAG02_NODE_1502_length_12258_cov_12.486142_2_plen_363_part_00
MHRIARIAQQFQPAVAGDGTVLLPQHQSDVAPSTTSQQAGEGWRGGDVDLIDFGHSYVQGPVSSEVRNAIRFWIESRTTLYDDKTGTSTCFYQCGECKSENTFGSHNLFHRDSYKFLPVYGEDALVVFHTGNLMQPVPPTSGARETYEEPGIAFPEHPGSGPRVAPGRLYDGPAVRGRGSTNENNPAPVQPPSPVPYRTITYGEEYAATGSFGVTSLQLHPAKGYEVDLTDYSKVVEATKAGHQLVGRTELSDPATGMRAVLEYPVKTMNLETATEIWQTDTGPVAVPDISRRYDPAIACISLGFVAANNRQLDRADFVLEQLMQLPGGGGVEVLHYCNPFSLPAKNTMWALPPPHYYSTRR